MPLTMSMEIMAEAAALLVPSQQLLGMQDVRAHRWIALENQRATLQIVARRRPSKSDGEIYVQIHEAVDIPETGEPAAVPVVEGTMIFGDAYPEAPVAGELVLQAEHSSRWTPDQLYEEVMFHGPSFRGVVSVDRSGEDGAQATIQALPVKGLFKSNPDPSFISDPILLDQPGQVVGFWTAERLETGYVIFPFRLEALQLYGPSGPGTEPLTCQARIQLVGEQKVRSDLDIVGADNQVRARLVGWEDRRFDLPRSFSRFLLSSRDTVLSSTWPTPIAGLSLLGDHQCCKLSLADWPKGFLEAHGGLWQRVLAFLVLAPRERELWRQLKTPEKRRTEWLLGRVVAKDATRLFVHQRYGIVLCPADIEILPDKRGRPVAHGDWSRDVPSVPILSLPHSDGVAVAVAGSGEAASGIGIDIEHVGRMGTGVVQLAFIPEELALLTSLAETSQDSWPLRLWCAKEAVAKALGQGLAAGPQALVVKALDSDQGTVRVSIAGELARQIHGGDSLMVTAYTAREESLIVAASLLGPKD